jgi:predicted RNase H-like HicB family nuclease
MTRAKRYTVTDGKLVLTLQEDEGGWYTVTSPVEPALVTQAKSIDQAFRMARDAIAALAASRSDLRRWDKASKRKLKRSA